jgi:hypothetical protein
MRPNDHHPVFWVRVIYRGGLVFGGRVVAWPSGF